MSDNIINFKLPKPPVKHMVTLNVYQNSDGEYEVEAEIDDTFEDAEIFEALIGATMKFAVDTGVATIEDDDDDGISPS